jgi:hypothetical protein
MIKTKKKFVSVSPLSKIAKNRFIHDMNSFHSCEVEQETDDKLFLVSLNRQYHFIVQKNGNEHWKVEK